MHFTTRNMNESGEFDFTWYEMQFKSDLTALLTKYGQLPFNSIEESLQAVQSAEKKAE